MGTRDLSPKSQHSPRPNGQIPLPFLLIALSAMATSGCQLKVSTTQLKTYRTQSQVTVETIQGLSELEWVKDSQSKIYLMASLVTVEGTCVRGVKEVHVLLAGVLVGTAAQCGLNGRFHWESTLVDGEYDLTFLPIMDGTSPTVVGVRQVLVVDTIAPAAPVILTNAGNPIISYNPSIEIEGEIAVDAYVAKSSGESTLTMTGVRQFSDTVVLAQGETALITFWAYDFAGNRSDPTVVQVSYMAATQLAASEFVGLSQNLAVESDTHDSVMEVATLAPIQSSFVDSDNIGSPDQTALASGASAIWGNL